MIQKMREFDAQTCLQMVHEIQQTFEELRVPIDKGQLAHDLDEIRWLAGHGDQIFASGGPVLSGAQRGKDAFWKAFRLDGVAQAMARIRGCKGFRNVLRRLKDLTVPAGGRKRIDQRVEGPWDIFLEVDVASRFVHRVDVKFAEPDVVITDSDGLVIGFACKRPKRPDAVNSNVERALSQIRESQLPGFIIVGTDIFTECRVDHDDGNSDNLEAESLFKLQMNPHREAIQTLLEREEPMDLRAGRGVAGVLLRTTFVHCIGNANESKKQLWIPRVHHIAVPHPDLAEPSAVFAAIHLLMGPGNEPTQ